MSNLSSVKQRVNNEGFDYCFRHYSNFKEIQDDEFHKLRKAYIEAANALEKYIDENSNDEENEID